MISRIAFNVLTDTGGDYADTGQLVEGIIRQIHYERDTGAPLDTGADITVSLPQSGVVVASYDNVGGASLTAIPGRRPLDTGGAAITEHAPIVAGGEPLRVAVNQSEGVAGQRRGKIYVWHG